MNVADQRVLMSPTALREQVQVTESLFEFVAESRATIERIIDRRDHRLVVVVGPCSIHDVTAALDYAKRLKDLANKVSDSLYLVMRVYFEKPRTTVGWKGLINDPMLDDSFEVESGLRIGRELLKEVLSIGLPTATQALDPITQQYLQDLISWSAIGARTTESQTHREMASGLSFSVGFKNGTDGGFEVAINALQSVANPHRFLGINSDGKVSVFETNGNGYGHVVLRGGSNGPNYSQEHIVRCEAALEQADLVSKRIAPGPIKAQTVALYYMCISMAGLFLGPTTVALLNDYVFGVDGIRYSMAFIPVIFGVPVLLGLRGILANYGRGVTEHEGLL